MQSRNGAQLFSASDLVNFMGCAYATVLDLRQLVSPVEFPADDDQVVGPPVRGGAGSRSRGSCRLDVIEH
ncbi:hypothetical protein KRR38_31485 [Novosphingobium sp. G106]|uniref:hypothetical protein n=1 Tax=Novosphingobium sp. G106 TaxID=2849500 RepID=UPI001C2DD46A|nr:hypothetical protein [Novosphingobium sp. G106]MBV1692072.1 hypothetical protein [Novosphingobium sp. G106]